MIKSLKLSTFDPRTKLMLMVCLSTIAVFRDEPPILLAVLAVTLLILLIGGVNLQTILRQAKAIFLLIFSVFVIQCLFVRTGEPLLSLGGFILLTTGGFVMAATVTLRFLILVMCALMLLTGNSADYLPAMVQMKIPYEIAFMVMAAVHFLPLLKEEAMDIYYSVQLRGTPIQGASLPKKIKAYRSICLPILVGAVNRAKTMSIAMEARGFRAKENRTYMRRLKLKTKDWLLIIALPLLTAVLMVVTAIY